VDRVVSVVGALSNVGARPYQDGAARDLDLAPMVLRERGLIARLQARDMGDVAAPPYYDFNKPASGVRNEAQVAAHARALAHRVSSSIDQGGFAVVIGGDCSIVLGCLLGWRRKAGDALGLVYVDAHTDYAVGDESGVGAAATMALALATGRTNSMLGRLAGDRHLVDARRTALIGRRDEAEGYGAIAASPILDVPGGQLQGDDWPELVDVTLEQVARSDSRGFWIQLDADVLSPAIMAAVDAPLPGGPTSRELIRLLTPLVRHPKALGLSLTSYDPALDPDRAGARQLLSILEALLVRSNHGLSQG
jgi:arginase